MAFMAHYFAAHKAQWTRALTEVHLRDNRLPLLLLSQQLQHIHMLGEL